MTAARHPAISVDKSATPVQVSALGDVIGYRFAVTNDGNVPLTSVGVTDTPAARPGRWTGQ